MLKVLCILKVTAGENHLFLSSTEVFAYHCIPKKRVIIANSKTQLISNEKKLRRKNKCKSMILEKGIPFS